MSENQLITKENGRIVAFFKSIDQMLDGLENLAKNHRRALQDYRNSGRLPYYKLGGKNLYRESDIQKMLDANYREAFK